MASTCKMPGHLAVKGENQKGKIASVPSQ